MIIEVRIKLPDTSRKPLKGTIEVKGPFDTGSVVTTITGFVVGKMSRVLRVGGIEIEVEPSVYEHYLGEGWTDAY